MGVLLASVIVVGLQVVAFPVMPKCEEETPDLYHRDRFGVTAHQAQSAYRFSRAHQEWLEEVACIQLDREGNPVSYAPWNTPVSLYQAALKEQDWRVDCWMYLWESFRDSHTEEYRRYYLNKLREKLGKDRWERGQMPEPYVPWIMKTGR